ncbi:MAG: hypothetical protein ABSF90_23325 [Syntrophobacteraceae bacterium]
MKKLLIPFLTLTWILWSAAFCIAADFCPAGIRLDSGTVSITLKDEVPSNCGNPAGKSAKSDLSEKKMNSYKPTKYINKQSNEIQHEDQGYSITRN